MQISAVQKARARTFLKDGEEPKSINCLAYYIVPHPHAQYQKTQFWLVLFLEVAHMVMGKYYEPLTSTYQLQAQIS